MVSVTCADLESDRQLQVHDFEVAGAARHVKLVIDAGHDDFCAVVGLTGR